MVGRAPMAPCGISQRGDLEGPVDSDVTTGRSYAAGPSGCQEPGAPAGYAAAAAPVIIPTTASWLVSSVRRVVTVCPSRMTVMRSETADTSGRFWLVMVTANPR